MISISRFVNIVSGVGAASGVRQRDLIGRIFTTNPMVSPDAIMEFSGDIAGNVGAVFGTTSEEFKRASFYASYVSPSISTPKKLSFARYAPTGSQAAVFGNTVAKDLNALKLIVAGVMSVTAGGTTTEVTGINFGAAVSLAAVATALQTKLQSMGAPLAAATVTFDATANRFTVNMGAAVLGAASINQDGASITDVGAAMGLYAGDGAINVSGIAAQQPVDAVQRSEGISNNFGSLLFMPGLSDAQDATVAQYVESLNVKYIYCVAALKATAAATASALSSFGGTALTLLSSAPGDFAEMIPMTILAATDYGKRNGAQSYMYKQFSGLTASVTTDADADTFDAIRVNYYGQTQTAGQLIAFYQRGTLMGTGSDPLDMNVYANEIWLKDFAASQLLSLQLAVGRLPANKTGAAAIKSILRGPIDGALLNGVISVGKTLTNVQRIFIEDVTGDPLAWNAVQNIGYVLSVDIQPFVTTSGATEFKAVYTLVYSKDDAIRTIEGTHTLI